MKKSRMQRIRERYNVPAKRGMRVKANGSLGTIVGTTANGEYLSIRLDGYGPKGLAYHPAWQMEYLVAEVE